MWYRWTYHKVRPCIPRSNVYQSKCVHVLDRTPFCQRLVIAFIDQAIGAVRQPLGSENGLQTWQRFNLKTYVVCFNLAHQGVSSRPTHLEDSLLREHRKPLQPTARIDGKFHPILGGFSNRRPRGLQALQLIVCELDLWSGRCLRGLAWPGSHGVACTGGLECAEYAAAIGKYAAGCVPGLSEQGVSRPRTLL